MIKRENIKCNSIWNVSNFKVVECLCLRILWAEIIIYCCRVKFCLEINMSLRVKRYVYFLVFKTIWMKYFYYIYVFINERINYFGINGDISYILHMSHMNFLPLQLNTTTLYLASIGYLDTFQDMTLPFIFHIIHI